MEYISRFTSPLSRRDLRSLKDRPQELPIEIISSLDYLLGQTFPAWKDHVKYILIMHQQYGENIIAGTFVDHSPAARSTALGSIQT